MSWDAYKLVYQAKSPIHIGWHTLGYIKLTRHYITGKAMWGAMTANLVRACYGYDDYSDIGNLLCSNIIASYFYPALDPDIPLLPRFTDDGLRYNGCSKSEFESLFIKSYGQTAVLPESNTAEDETLHESEYISPVVGTEQNPVYFVGYIFISNDTEYDCCKIEWANIKDAVSELFIGGDRKYGWGRLQLDIEKTKDTTVDKAFESKLVLSERDMQIEISNDYLILPAHLKINDGLKIKGDLEPLVGREWGIVTDKEGRQVIGDGQKISDANICWMPGSIMTEEKGKTLTMGKFGILE